LRRRRILGKALAAAIAMTVVACELAVGLDPYTAGCPVGEKECPDVTTSVKKCVAANDPNYGCATSGCQACAQAAAGNSPPRGIPTEYGCSTSGLCVPNGSTCPGVWQHCDTFHPYCESNSQSDPANCGNCGHACPASAPNASALGCVSGNCKVITCESGFADCDGDPGNGCEVQLGMSNCWSCPPLTDAGAQCCRACYAGPEGFVQVCPACAKPTGTCNTTSMQCE
jgi:hypothetical protein